MPTIKRPTGLQVNPRTLADLMTDPLDAAHGFGAGRNWTVSDGAKRVRSIARDTIDRFINRTGRTTHVYDATEAASIVTEARKAGTSGAGASAASIREASAPKAARKPRKAAPKAVEATEATDAS